MIRLRIRYNMRIRNNGVTYAFWFIFLFFLLPLIRLIYLIRRLTLDDITILEDNSVRTEKLRVCDVDWRFEVKLIDVGNPVGFSQL
jgi:hypothetical protein